MIFKDKAEVRGEPIQVSAHLLVESLGWNAVHRRKVSIEQDALTADQQNPFCDVGARVGDLVIFHSTSIGLAGSGLVVANRIASRKISAEEAFSEDHD